MPALPVIGSLVGIGGNIFSGIAGRNAAKEAGSDIVNSDMQAWQQIINAVQQGQAGVGGNVANAQSWMNGAVGQANTGLGQALQSIQGNYSPYVQAGQGSLQSLADLAGPNGQLAKQFSFNPSDLQNDPGYQFTLGQGQQAIQRSAAAQGGLFSGGTLKSLAGYTTGSANQYFNDAFNRALQTFGTNRQGALAQAGIYSNLAGMGLQGAGGLSNATEGIAGQQGANTIGGAKYAGDIGLQGAEYGSDLGLKGATLGASILQNIGNAQAASKLGATSSFWNGIGQALPGITGLISSGFGGLFGGGGGGGGGFGGWMTPGAVGIPGGYQGPSPIGAGPGGADVSWNSWGGNV